MILYLDTSALVKRYFQEPFSEEVADLWKKAAEIRMGEATCRQASTN